MLYLGLVLAGLVSKCSVASTGHPIDLQYHVNLSTDNHYHLFWDFNEDNITLEVHVKTQGWVGFGLSSNGGMRGSDITIGWVTSDGQAILQDRHGVGNEMPVMDDQQDYQLLWGEQNNTHTILRFSRKLLLCNSDDTDIDAGTQHLIFAWGESDPVGDVINYHGAHRGSKSQLLLLYGVPDAEGRKQYDSMPYFDVTANEAAIGPDKTTYWCRIVPLPRLDRKHHIVRAVPIIEPENVAVVHHIVIYFCNGQLVPNERGKRCWEGRMPENSTDCDTLAYGWAKGQEEFHYPDNVGMPIGGPGSPGFFHMEIHYDNIHGWEGNRDSSGLRFYYTSDIRQHDAGTFLTGHSLWWPPMTIPPHSDGFTVDAYCARSCTKHFPQKGITMFALFPHTHLTGAAVQVRHLRNGKEIGYIGKDDHYDFNFQFLRHTKKPIVVLPEDEMITSCTFDTRKRTDTTFGGPGTDHEMCFMFMMYYPRMPVQTCLSTTQPYYPVHQLVMKKAMDGEIMIDPLKKEKNMYKHLNNISWSQDDIDGFQKQSRNVNSFTQFCTMEKQGFGVFGGGESTTEEVLKIKEQFIDHDSLCINLEETSSSSFIAGHGLIVLFCLSTVWFVP